MNDELTFEMTIDGKRHTCTVLFTFYSDQTKANYMLYTPDDPTKVEQLHLMAGRFDPENLTAIHPLQDDTDRAIVQQFLDYVTQHTSEEIAQEAADDGIDNIEDL